MTGGNVLHLDVNIQIRHNSLVCPYWCVRTFQKNSAKLSSSSTNNGLCTVLKQIYRSTGLFIAYPYDHLLQCQYSKKNMPRFFIIILTHLSDALWYNAFVCFEKSAVKNKYANENKFFAWPFLVIPMPLGTLIPWYSSIYTYSGSLCKQSFNKNCEKYVPSSNDYDIW